MDYESRYIKCCTHDLVNIDKSTCKDKVACSARKTYDEHDVIFVLLKISRCFIAQMAGITVVIVYSQYRVSFNIDMTLNI